ncbi:MAG: hypothetical protein HFH47_03255 [Bacilli bacterium]|nr:hypothetical protein [Bacilli bacterium]
MKERLEVIEERYNELALELSKPEVLSDIKKTLELTKEQASLKDAVTKKDEKLQDLGYKAYLEQM